MNVWLLLMMVILAGGRVAQAKPDDGMPGPRGTPNTMGRLRTIGFEIAPAGGPARFEFEGTRQNTSLVTTSTSTVRTGTNSIKFDSGAANASDVYMHIGLNVGEAGPLGTTYFFRAYYNFENLPSTDCQLIAVFADLAGNNFGTQLGFIKLTTAGNLQLWRDGGAQSQVGSDSSATLTTGQWYMIEISFKTDTGANDALEARIDGVSFASATGLSLADGVFGAVEWGWETAPGANKVCYTDDVALNSSLGSDQNSWPGSGKIVLLKPISDNQRGSWTGGAGGTTNLWDAINNTPPIGTASETDLTQIENADTSPDNATDEYRANMTSYTTAGLVSTDTITLCHAVIDHGEDASTGTKTGSFRILSNPVQAAVDTFTFGHDNPAGALATWPTRWSNDWGTPQYTPSVTLVTSPVMAIRKTDTGNRVASVDFAGIYVEYVSGVASNRHRMALLGVGK